MFCPEDKDVPQRWTDEIITELIYKNLVAGVDGAAGDNLAALITSPGAYLKIMRQSGLRSIDPMGSTVGDNSRPGKKEKILLLDNFADSFILRRNHINVVASQN